jgi:hypothetical protein
MTIKNLTNTIKLYWIRLRSSLIAFIVVFLYVIVDLEHSLNSKDLFSISINALSILFGFNMVVVTQYFSNTKFNIFLKKLNSFNGFKNKYKRIIKTLVVSLIALYVISIFSGFHYCFFERVSFEQVSNYCAVFLTVWNLMKAYDIVVEFFNVYGTTYSNTMQNINDE